MRQSIGKEDEASWLTRGSAALSKGEVDFHSRAGKKGIVGNKYPIDSDDYIEFLFKLRYEKVIGSEAKGRGYNVLVLQFSPTFSFYSQKLESEKTLFLHGLVFILVSYGDWEQGQQRLFVTSKYFAEAVELTTEYIDILVEK